MTVTTTDFGSGYHLITLTNKLGTTLSVTDLGARIVSLKPIVNGTPRELVLGFDSADEYLTKDLYIGATIGRTAGRIKKGQFVLSGQTIQVDTDPENGHTLHGGTPGFEAKKWRYSIAESDHETSVIFTTTSPDGEHGFPGALDVTARYTLTDNDVWRVTVSGVSDKETLFNPTNHVYFNLTGDPGTPIDDHRLFLNSDTFAPLLPDSIPTGAQVPINNTAFDFLAKTKIGPMFQSEFPQEQLVGGMDHPFFLLDSGLEHVAAELTSPDLRVSVSVRTNASSVVVFTANFGNQTPAMRGTKLVNHGGITFETQTAPGAEQFPDFGTIVLPKDTEHKLITEFIISK